MNATREELPRQFGFWSGTAVVVASMVGTGILFAPGFTIRATQNHAVCLVLWSLGGVLALCGALTLAEMATAYPEAGGEYVYVRRAFGPLLGFVYGWTSLLLGFAAPTALVALTAVNYLLRALPESIAKALQHESCPSVQGGATALIIAFTIIHCMGQRKSAWTQTAATVFKALTLLFLVVVGLSFGRGDWSHFTTGSSWRNQSAMTMALALIGINYSYIGWNGAVYLAGELRDPARLLPRCLIVGGLAVTALYLAINLTFAFTFAPVELQSLKNAEIATIATQAVKKLFPQAGAAQVFSLLVGLGVLATVSVFLLSGPRVVFAMARAGQLPAFLGAWDSRRQAPAIATIAQGIIAVALIWLAGGEKPMNDLLNYAGLGLAVIGCLFASSIFLLRRRIEYRPQFRVPLYPVPPLVFLAISVTVVALACKDLAEQTGWKVAVASFGTIAVGIPLYYINVWLARRGRFPPPTARD